MTCTLARASEADIRRLREDPEKLGEFLYGELPVQQVSPRSGFLGFLLRLSPIRIEELKPGSLPPSTPEREGRNLDIEKAWHGLHFLFTGTAWEGEEPACYLLKGGVEISDEDGARALSPDRVRRFAAFLAEFSRDELSRRYDPEQMTALEIYPDVIWKRPASEDSPFDYLAEYFEELRTFVAAAAADGDGLIVSVI